MAARVRRVEATDATVGGLPFRRGGRRTVTGMNYSSPRGGRVVVRCYCLTVGLRGRRQRLLCGSKADS